MRPHIATHTPNPFPLLALALTALVTLPPALAAQVEFDAYLKASNTDADDLFGTSVAVSGDTLVIGAPQEDSAASGVNGAQFNENASAAGAAYVYVRVGDTWIFDAYLKAGNPDANDLFGSAVAISGDTVVVGAPGEAAVTTGVNGSGLDDSLPLAGAAYVFERVGGTWSQQAYLKPSNTDLGDEFGAAVAVSGDTVIVGARLEDGGATGVNGDDSSDTLTNSGAAYVFRRVSGAWSQQAYLKPQVTSLSDMFGSAVALSGDLALVGAPGEDSPAIGVNGNPAPDTLSDAGAAYAFARINGQWVQQAYLKASNAGLGDRFGSSVAVSADTAVVGAPNEKSAATGVNGEQLDDSSLAAGAAYVFRRTLGVWSQQAYLKASNTDATDFFGNAVALDGDALLVGALSEDGGAVLVNGDDSSDSVPGSGAGYLFLRSLSNWNQAAYLKANNTDPGDRFGLSVALSGSVALLGADEESSSAVLVDGNEQNDAFPSAGAAFSYDLGAVIDDPWFDEGGPLAGALGNPSLEGAGPLVAGSDNFVQLTNAAPSAFAAVFLAPDSDPVPFKGGVLQPFPFLDLLFTSTTPAGTRSLAFVMPDGVPAGTELWLQFAVQDSTAPRGVALSNAIRGVTP